jgi:phosphoadenosine phosphosulfate reductase
MSEHLDYLNDKYSALTPSGRIEEIFRDFDPEKILVTSSFGTSSVYLLSLLNRVRKEQKIYFIDTGYLFSETHEYKNTLRNIFGLNIVMLEPDTIDHAFTEKHKIWESDPDFCCSVNKVSPLEKIKPAFDIWMTGRIAYQGSSRENMRIFEEADIIKFNPVLDVSKQEIREFISLNQLPGHPLLRKGYGSVGCTHCTKPGGGRTGRWPGRVKTECGLHAGSNIQA